MLGRRSSPTVCRYGDLDTLGEHREPQYSEEKQKNVKYTAHFKLNMLSNAHPTCGTKEEDRRFSQEPIDLISYCDLSMGE